MKIRPIEIYELLLSEKCRRIRMVEGQNVENNMLIFNGLKKEDSWPLDFEWEYVEGIGTGGFDFCSVGTKGAFAFGERVFESDLCQSVLLFVSECLPVFVGKERMYIANVTKCLNVLDKKMSHMEYDANGNISQILRYNFHPHRIDCMPLFKIPQTWESQILVNTFVEERKKDFRAQYKLQKFSGLEFRRLWSEFPLLPGIRKMMGW